VRQVLAQPSYRASAERMAARLAAAPGPSRAAELLEALAGGDRSARRPLATGGQSG